MLDKSIVSRFAAKRRAFWLAIVIMLLAGTLRFFRLDYQELRGDEAASWARVTQTSGPVDLAQRLIREGQPHPPIHYWLLQIWERLTGESEFALRSSSALLSWLLVALIYRVALRVTRQRSVAVLAMLIGAVQPYQIWLAQDVKNMYELAPIGLMCATLLLPRVLRGDRRAWLLYVLSAALSVLSYYYAMFGLMAHGAYLLWARSDRRSVLRWLSAGAAAAVCVLPWIMLIWPKLAVKQFNHPSQQPISQFLLQTLGDAVWGPSLPPDWSLPGILLIGFLALFGAFWLWRSRREWSVMLSAWFLITVIGIYIGTRYRAIYNPFYLSNAYPALYILIAVGLLAFMRRRVLLILLSGIILIGYGTSLSNYYFQSAYSRSVGLRRVAMTIQTEARSGDALITNQPDPAAIYYLRNLVMPIVLLPPSLSTPRGQIDQAITDVAAQHNRLWFTPTRSAWDPAGLIETQLRDRYLLATDARFKSTRLQTYVPRAEEAAAYHSLKIEFDQGIQLVGSYVTLNGDPLDHQPQAGEWLRVTLFWTTSAAIPIDYKVFVHAVDAASSVVAQHDSMPHQAAQPTSSWQSQEVVLDAHEFQLPVDGSPASLVIRIGLYDPESGDRLKTLTGADSVEVWSSESP
jgi:4-amino-4-deoxy-L-arabinose transferase-like glycosyltransferase